MKDSSIKRLQSNTSQSFSNKVFSALLRKGEVKLDSISKEVKKVSRPVCIAENGKTGKRLEKENYVGTQIFEDNYKTPFTEEYYEKKKIQFSGMPEDNLEHFTTKKLNHFMNNKPIGSKKHCGTIQKKESCFLIKVKRNEIGPSNAKAASIARKKGVQDLYSGNPFEKLDQIRTSSIRIVNRESSLGSNHRNQGNNSQPKLLKLEIGNFVETAPSSSKINNKSFISSFDTKITNKSMPSTPSRKNSLTIKNKGSLLPEKLNTTKSSPKSVRKELGNAQRDSSNVKLIMNNKKSNNHDFNLKEKISNFPFKTSANPTRKQSC